MGITKVQGYWYIVNLCTHALSVFRPSQDRVAAQVRWGGWDSHRRMCR